MSEHITISVDESLSDLIPGFLERKRADVQSILDALPRHDYERVRRAAHRLKGEGGAYGFDAMTELARVIERALAAHDDTAIKRHAEALLNYVDRVKVVFHPAEE
ncbi:MAG: Hpt domain-containing protein [Candidatus Binatus sp.]|uniref:Hpt domain-containing protein n=1 Tax=Candidatus Binatus sp. TaxID=2811406 RepID=UPI002727E2C6|nr:Hpt domain-containing protein [Candidatus Binatus sp.]MDO8434182.1 Hpt domain-containing protein [Candidatus Binatus sp.]